MSLEVTEKVSSPEIRRARDYRKFLREFYAFKKATRAGFSYRLFATKCGIKSPNYLQLVIQGKRNLSPELAARVAEAMGLKGAERDYFVALVERECAATPREQAMAERSRLSAARRLASRGLEASQGEVLARWYHLLVREMAALPDFEADGDWISRRLEGRITPAQAADSFELLVKHGFVKRRSDGSWESSEPVLDTGDAFDFARVLEMHRQTLAVWRDALETLGPEDREMGLLNFTLRRGQVPELKRRMRAFQDEIIGWLTQEQQADPRGEEVYQLGTYLLPLTTKD